MPLGSFQTEVRSPRCGHMIGELAGRVHRGLVGAAGRFTDGGRVTGERIEAFSDELAASARTPAQA